MVDENGRQTITNDGATVMKVRGNQLRAINSLGSKQFSSFG